MAVVLDQLAHDQWTRQVFDSARYYHLRAAGLLRQAFPGSLHAARSYRIDGKMPQPAVMMAEHYCNAGLASQALGQLPQAMDYYESGRQAYAWAANLAGQAWVHSLFAEALLAQRQQPRAARHFEQALALLRRQAHV